MKRLIAILLILVQTFLFASNSWATSTEQNNWQHKNSSLMPQSDPKGIWGPVQISIFAHPDSLILVPQINIPEGKGLEKTLQNPFTSNYTTIDRTFQSFDPISFFTDIIIDLLIIGLGSDISYVRDFSIRQLIILGEDAIPALIETLGSPDENKRTGAIQVLIGIGEPAIPYLIQALNDPVRAEWAKQALISLGESAVGSLSEALNNPTNSVSMRREAALILGQIGSSEAAEALISALGDSDPAVNTAIKDALIQAGNQAVEPLSAILNNPANSTTKRQDAARLLGRIGGPRATQALISALGDEDVYLTVVYALSQIGSPEAVQALLTALREEQDWGMRIEIVDALARIGSPEAIKGLIAVYGNPSENEWVRSAALEALVQIGAPAIAPLSEVLNSPASSMSDRQAAAWVLGIIGGPEAAQALIAALDDESISVRSTVVDALFQIGEPAIEPLRTALVDSNPLIRQGARQVLLARFGNAEFRNYLEERINSETDPANRRYLEESLTSLDEAARIIEQIKQTYHIEVDDRFDVIQLQSILTTLQVFPADKLQGLDKIEFNPEMGLVYYGVYISSDDPSNASGDNIIQLMIFGPDETFINLFHELGHFFDDKYLGYSAFAQLYNPNGPLEDFAQEYGRIDFREDFATTFEAYCMNPKTNFLRAIGQAQAGQPVYLEKLLFVLDFSTMGHPDYAIIYRVEGNSVRQTRLTVTRDDTGRITHIQDVSVTDLDALEVLFLSIDL